jgi:hypothetical protein
MRRKKLIFLSAGVLCLAVIIAALVVNGTQAAPEYPAATYSIPWWSVDNGGGASQGGLYSLRGTSGQPDAGSSTGGVYSLKGGFWTGFLDSKSLINYALFLSLLFR